MIDARLKGTKCAECINGHDFFLESVAFTACADCKDRPNRNKDISRFESDVKRQDTKDYLDKIGRIGTESDY